MVSGQQSWLRPNHLAEACTLDLESLGRVCILAPHPDDETLGCGGLIALLAGRAQPILVVGITDGAASHPGSLAYPPPALGALRRHEMSCALRRLGLDNPAIAWLNLEDGNLPGAGHPDFAAACLTLEMVLTTFEPATLVAPWRRDPHADHRATWEIARAMQGWGRIRRLLEYPVWLGEQGDPEDLPRSGEARLFALDVRPVLDRKRDAIGAHRSQTTTLIDDDPQGFRLDPAMIERLTGPVEIYFEVLA